MPTTPPCLDVVFANGALGTISATRWCPGHANRLALKIAGTKGTIDFESERSTTAYRICTGKAVHAAAWGTIEVPPTPTNHERFIRAIRTGKPEQPDFDRGAEAAEGARCLFRLKRGRQVDAPQMTPSRPLLGSGGTAPILEAGENRRRKPAANLRYDSCPQPFLPGAEESQAILVALRNPPNSLRQSVAFRMKVAPYLPPARLPLSARAALLNPCA